MKSTRTGLLVWAILAVGIVGIFRYNKLDSEKYIHVTEQCLQKTVTVHVRISRIVIKNENGIQIEIKQYSNSIGSGVYISPEGHILTAAHVITFPYKLESIIIEDYFGHLFPATILAKDVQKDIALLKVDEIETPYTKIAKPGDVREGQEVIAIGSPFGLQGSVTSGIISALHRDQFGYDQIQISAPINPGNSGGPLFNLNGELIGINIFIVTAAPYPTWSGIGFSVSASEINRFLVRFRSLEKAIH